MFGRRITLFKMLGFEVRVDASWLLIAFLITWSLAVGVFPNELPGLLTGTYWWMGIAGALGLFGSIVIHEFSHSIVARHYGVPMKGITLFIFGGVAEMEEEPPNPKTEFLMAIAGPLASVAIGGVFYAIGAAARTSWPIEFLAVVGYLSSTNWLLAGFNMIPAFPLDGGRVLRAALWQRSGNLVRATRTAAFAGSSFGTLLIVGGVLQLLWGNFVGAVWWFLLGMFLRMVSAASYHRVLLQSVLKGEPVRRFMNRNLVSVPPDITVQDLVGRSQWVDATLARSLLRYTCGRVYLMFPQGTRHESRPQGASRLTRISARRMVAAKERDTNQQWVAAKCGF